MFSLIKKIIITMENVPIIPLVVIATLVMMSFQALFSKLMKMLLEKVQFLEWDRNFFLKVVWRLCFILVSSMVIIIMINGSLADLLLLPFKGNIDLEKELAFCKSHKKVVVSGVTSAFIMHTGYYAANTIFGLIDKSYKTLEFLRMEIMLAILMLTYYSKCPLYGMAILLISHRSALFENISKLCILLGRHTDSENLARTSVGFFVYHCALWFATFFIEIPMFLSINKTIDTSMMFAELNLLIIIHGFVVMYVIVSLFEGPLGRLVMAYVTHAPDEEKNLIYYLFGTNLAHRRTCSVTESFRRDSGRRNSRALMQIIRTSTVLRRKAREARHRIEQRKSLQEAAAIAAAQAAEAREVLNQGISQYQGIPKKTKRFIKPKDRLSARQRALRYQFASNLASPSNIDDQQPGTSSQSERIPPLVDTSEESLLAYQSKAQHQRRPLRKRDETELSRQESSLPKSTTTDNYESGSESLESDLSRDTPKPSHSYMLRPRTTPTPPTPSRRRSRLD